MGRWWRGSMIAARWPRDEDGWVGRDPAGSFARRGQPAPSNRRLFTDPKRLGTIGLRRHAEAVGLDAREFEQCIGGGKHAAKIQREWLKGRRLGSGHTNILRWPHGGRRANGEGDREAGGRPALHGVSRGHRRTLG